MNIKKASQGFAAAGADSRLAVLKKLVRSGPKGISVGELQKSLKIPPSTLAHHLRYLAAGGLIEQRKSGRQIINIADFKHIRALADFLVSECCADTETIESCF